MASVTILTMDLKKGVTAVNLTLPEMLVEVGLELDKELLELAKAGKEGVRLERLGDAARTYLQNVQKIVKEEVTRLDAKVVTLTQEERQKMIETTNHALRNAVLGSKSGAEAAVQAEWEKMKARSKALTKHNLKVAYKVTMGVIAIGVSLASIIASAGILAVSVVVTLKSTAELGLIIGDELVKADQTGKEMMELHDKVAADIKKQVGLVRNVVADSSPIFAAILPTLASLTDKCSLYEAKLAGVEKDTDKMVGKLNEGLDKIVKLEKVKAMDPKKKTTIEALKKKNMELIGDIQAIQKDMPKAWAVCEKVKADIKTWKAKQTKTTSGSFGLFSIGRKVAAITAAANAIGQLVLALA